MLGVVKLVPVPNEAPPVDVAYQVMVPADVAACRVAGPEPQIDAPVVEVNVGRAFTVATTAVLGELVQPLLVTSA